MKIESIPAKHYHDYRLNVMFDGYKWDLQAGQQSTISDKVLLMEPAEAAFLSKNLRSIKLRRNGVKAEAFSGFATTTRAGGTLGVAKLLNGFAFASIRCDFIDRRF